MKKALFSVALSKAGTNPDQRPSQSFSTPIDPREAGLNVGDIFHAEGQPDDVLWKIEEIARVDG